MTIEELKEYQSRQRCFYTKDEINLKLQNVSKSVVVNSLPDTGTENYLYLVPSLVEEGKYDLYIWENGDWQFLGSVEGEFTDFVTEPELEAKSPFVVIVSEQNNTLTADKTFAEIKQAWDDGRVVIARDSTQEYIISDVDVDGIMFTVCNYNSNGISQLYISDNNSVDILVLRLIYYVTITKNDNVWTCNKTNAEIYLAYQNGNTIVLTDLSSLIYYPLSINSTDAIFSAIEYDDVTIDIKVEIQTVDNVQTVTYQLFTKDEGSVSTQDITDIINTICV